MARASGGAIKMHPLSWGGGGINAKYEFFYKPVPRCHHQSTQNDVRKAVNAENFVR